jgi:DNA-binding MarR family transcriptional regulator
MPRQSRVQREIRQNRPFRSPGHEAVVALLRTVDVVRRALGAVVEAEDITLQQYNVLRILRGAGDGPVPTLEIGARMIEQAPGITRLLDRLVKKRLVRRERCRADRRQVLCRITDEGRALLARLDPVVDRADASVLAGVPSREIPRLVSLLDRVRAGAAASSGASLPLSAESRRT